MIDLAQEEIFNSKVELVMCFNWSWHYNNCINGLVVFCLFVCFFILNHIGVISSQINKKISIAIAMWPTLNNEKSYMKKRMMQDRNDRKIKGLPQLSLSLQSSQFVFCPFQELQILKMKALHFCCLCSPFLQLHEWLSSSYSLLR